MAGRIPKQFIDELLLRADIVEVIDARVPLKKAGKDYKACCPFHEEKTASFTVSATKQFYHCFGCGAHGTAIGFLMEFEHMSFPEAVEELAGRAGLSLPKEVEATAERADSAAGLLTVLEEAARYYRSQLKEAPRAVTYLKGRGISGEIAAAFGLGYAPDGWDNVTRLLGKSSAERDVLIRSGLAIRKDGGGCYDRFRDRVMFPIHDYRGRIVGFGGRIIDAVQGSTNVAGDRMLHRDVRMPRAQGEPEEDQGPGDLGPGERARQEPSPGFRAKQDRAATKAQERPSEATKGGPKYLNSPETPLFHKGRELYGLFRARDSIRKAGRVIVVEGYMDVVGLAQAGVDIAVATLGTATTRDHLERLFRFVPEIVFCFDGDRAGREAAWRALDIVLPVLHEGRHASFMFLPEGEDPDTLVQKEGKEAFLARSRTALTVPDFLFKGLAEQVDMNRSSGRLQLAELAQPYLSKVPAGLLRDTMLDRLKLSPAMHDKLSVQDDRRVARSGNLGPKRPAPIMRLAVAFLVQHPELAAHVDNLVAVQALELPGMPLFRMLVNLIKSSSMINTAAIVEHFRDSEHEHSIARLAAWRHSALDHDMVAEFQGLLLQMRRVAVKEKVDTLLQKEKISGLTSAEKAELANLTRLPVEKTGPAPH